MKKDITFKEADFDFGGAKFRVRELGWYDRDVDIPQLAAFYCGGNFNGVRRDVQIRALLLAEAKLRIVESPDWFTDVVYHFESNEELKKFVEGARALFNDTPGGETKADESGAAGKA
jgi:hypothetical protein